MKEAVRDHGSLLASSERRLLIAIARRLPAWVSSDQLTLLALAAMAMAGGGYVLAHWDRRALWLSVVGLALNWFGDSLDGTVARVRKTERPRYGFYVDHVVDIVGATLLFGGLAMSPFMSPVVALCLLVAYLLVSAEVYLATSVRHVFRMSFAWVGPTELRLLLAAGTITLLDAPQVSVGALGTWPLFDVGGVLAAAGLAVALLVSSCRTTRELRALEPLRPRGQPGGGDVTRAVCGRAVAGVERTAS